MSEKYGVMQEPSGWCVTLDGEPRNVHWVARVLNEQEQQIADLQAELTQIRNLCNPDCHKAECECVTCQIINLIKRV